MLELLKAVVFTRQINASLRVLIQLELAVLLALEYKGL